MILYRDGDSTYIAADTLFSGLRKYDSLERKVITQTDTLKKTLVVVGKQANNVNIDKHHPWNIELVKFQEIAKVNNKIIIPNLIR